MTWVITGFQDGISGREHQFLSRSGNPPTGPGSVPSGDPGRTALTPQSIEGGCRLDPELGVTVNTGLHQDPGIVAAAELLAARGAAGIPHPGGTLLAHLERVHALLAQWGARPALRRAGLCHAFYGTDGFAVALGDPSRRDELAAIIGEQAERLVYFYASCDRRFSYPHLAAPAGPFKDRFTDIVLHPPLSLRRDFAELTVANELDIAAVNPDLRSRAGPALLRLFTSWRNLLSETAWQAVHTALS